MSMKELLTELDAGHSARIKEARATLRSAYVRVVTELGGVKSYDASDDTFMDAIDTRIEMVAKRAGIRPMETGKSWADEPGAGMESATIQRPAILVNQPEVNAVEEAIFSMKR